MNSFRKYTLVSIFLTLFCGIGSGFPSPSPRLLYLGRLENKIFYYHPEPSTWDEAVLACGSNTELVKLESETEKSFISAIMDEIDENYWTAGKDIATDKQFGWFGSETDNKGLQGEWYDGKPVPRSCVIYNPYTQAFFNYLCTDKLRAICQSLLP